jgi:replicative DNA helicase
VHSEAAPNGQGPPDEVFGRHNSGEERPAEILERAESQIFRIASREIRGGFQPTRELAAEAYKEIEETSKNRTLVSGIDTGFTGKWLVIHQFHKPIYV